MLGGRLIDRERPPLTESALTPPFGPWIHASISEAAGDSTQAVHLRGEDMGVKERRSGCQVMLDWRLGLSWRGALVARPGGWEGGLLWLGPRGALRG